MIAKLRRKLVFLLMGVVALILLAVFASTLLSAAGNARRMSENLLRQALAAQPNPQGVRPPQREGELNPPGAAPPGPRSSVLVAEIGADGEISFLSNQLHFIEEDDAMAAVQAAVKSGNPVGILGDYELRWMKSEDGGRVALADISMEREMLRNLVLNSLLIGGAALAAFFFASLYLSRWAVRPVALAWERQKQFIADASHELKTPLTVILSNADMLSADGTFADEKKARRMEHIQTEAARMKRLVEDLLTLARSDSAESVRVRERVDYSYIVTDAVLTFEPTAFDEGKNLSYDVRDKLFGTGDARRLQQLIAILLDNAVKYCRPGGEIKLSLAEGERKTALLSVSSEGEPIPKEELEKIFHRFYRIDPSRSSTHGSFGLGLSIAESIVREHGGKIWAENHAKRGNIFFVLLPLE